MERLVAGEVITFDGGLQMDCGRCGTKDVAARVVEYPNEGLEERFTLVLCGHCGEVTAGLLQSLTFPPNSSELTFTAGSEPDRSRFRVLRIYPVAAPPEVATYAPAAIRDLLHEGFVCLNAGALVAGTLIARTAVQAIARDQLGDQAKRGARLNDEIELLEIPGYMRDAAHGIRLLGNTAAHDGADYIEDVEASTLTELLDFTVELVRHLYEMPARARELRERAQAGNGMDRTAN